MRRWRTAQKVVFLIGLAVALLVVTRVVLAPDPLSSESGWFNYAPNSGLAYDPMSTGRSAIAIGAVHLGAIAVWTAIAVWLFGVERDG